MIFTFISSSDRIPWEGVKQSFSFLAVITYTLMILNASVGMNYYHYPLQPGQVNSLSMQTSYLWLVIEQLVFISLLISNMFYICLRSCFHHKLSLDQKDTKRQLPGTDTIIATTEVVNAFNA